MIVAGIDIGSISAKAVVRNEEEILGWKTIPTFLGSAERAEQVMQDALDMAGLSMNDVEYVVSTGYGRVNVPFADKNITEISCHARGTHYIFPQVRTILDMGGQDCKVIKLDESGKVADFAMNDKCAAGTGRYLEKVAAVWDLPLDQMGQMSLEIINEPVIIDSYCVVFAETDIMALLRQGKHMNDILAGAHDSLTRRIKSLVQKVGVADEFSISGGIAKNIGIVQRLEKELGLKANIAPDPQIVGAIGAAGFAHERLTKQLASKQGS